MGYWPRMVQILSLVSLRLPLMAMWKGVWPLLSVNLPFSGKFLKFLHTVSRVFVFPEE